MKLFRSMGGALSLASLLGLLLVSSTPAGAQTLTALSLERSVALNNILTTITPTGLSSAALAAIAAGSLDIREQSNFNPTTNTLTTTVFVVPTGAPNPTNLSQLPFASFVASTTMSIDKIYITSKPYNAVSLVGTVTQSTNTPYGNYLGAAEQFSFGFTSDKPPKINNVIEVFGGAVVIYSAASQGTFTITQPSTGVPSLLLKWIGSAACSPTSFSHGFSALSFASPPPSVRAANASAGCAASAAVYAIRSKAREKLKPCRWRGSWVICSTRPPAAGMRNTCASPPTAEAK